MALGDIDVPPFCPFRLTSRLFSPLWTLSIHSCSARSRFCSKSNVSVKTIYFFAITRHATIFHSDFGPLCIIFHNFSMNILTFLFVERTEGPRAEIGWSEVRCFSSAKGTADYFTFHPPGGLLTCPSVFSVSGEFPPPFPEGPKDFSRLVGELRLKVS